MAIAACSGLAAFAVAIFAGLGVGNDGLSIILRAIVCMAVCWVLGFAAGTVGMHVLREHVEGVKAREPLEVEMEEAEEAVEEEEPIEV